MTLPEQGIVVAIAGILVVAAMAVTTSSFDEQEANALARWAVTDTQLHAMRYGKPETLARQYAGPTYYLDSAVADLTEANAGQLVLRDTSGAHVATVTFEWNSPAYTVEWNP